MLDFLDKLFKTKSGTETRSPRSGYSTRYRAFTEQPRLQYLLPWRSINRKTGVIYGKANDFLQVFEFRGRDMASATQAELMDYNEKLNTIIQHLPTGYVLYLETQRRFASGYDRSSMPSAVLQYMEDSRADYYNSRSHFENAYYFIIYYEPPSVIRKKLTDAFIRDERHKHQNTSEDLKIFLEQEEAFLHQCDLIGGMLNHIFTDLVLIDDADALTSYLHSTISNSKVALKYNPQRYLCDYIVDCSFTAGREPMLGNKHLRLITVLDFPQWTTPGILGDFEKLGFEYRFVSRYICMSNRDAYEAMKKYQQRWSQQARDPLTIIREAITKEPSGDMLNEEALMNTDDCTFAITELKSGQAAYGCYTMTMLVTDEDPRLAEEKANKIVEILNSLGFTGYVEKDNAAEAWWGSLPGCYRANIRQPLVSSKNFCHLAPVVSTWSGDKRDYFLKAPVLLYTDTVGQTPFRLSLHVKDLGHTMVVGPSGTGKSVLLNTLEAHFLKYRDSNVFVFDKAASSRAITLAVGGSFYNLTAEGAGELSFQPLAHIDDEQEKKWAKEWLLSYLRQRNLQPTPLDENLLWQALQSLAQMPPEQRTLTNFVIMVQDNELRTALRPLTMEGSYGRLFDNSEDFSGSGRWQVFEMEALMATPAIVPTTLEYLFHRIETSLKVATGPSIMVLDECWLFFDNPAFKEKLREYFKDMRKKNTSIIFATQNLADVANKPELLTTIAENCANQIYLPNPNAITEQSSRLYRLFGCNDAQIRLIAGMLPKSDYYYTSQSGDRVFRLALQEAELPFVTATSKEDQQELDKLLAELTEDGKALDTDTFVYRWYCLKGKDLAAQHFQEVYAKAKDKQFRSEQ